MTVDHHVGVVGSGAAAPHLAGRFLGSNSTDGGRSGRRGVLRWNQLTNTTHMHTGPFSGRLHQSLCHLRAPALNMFTFTQIRCAVSENQDINISAGHAKLAEWFATLPTPARYTRHTHRHAGKHRSLLSRCKEMSVVWDKLFVFCHCGDHTQPLA